MDSLGQLLVTGDDSGSICARLLHPRESSNSAASRAESARGTGDTAYPSQEFGAVVVAGGAELGAGSGSGGGGVAKVVEGAHKGDVLAIRHVEGSLRMSTSMSRSEGLSEGLSEDEGGAEASWSSLFVSGGKGEGLSEEMTRAQGQARAHGRAREGATIGGTKDLNVLKCDDDDFRVVLLCAVTQCCHL